MSADRWAEGRAVLRAADPRMAVLVDADPGLDPDAFFDNRPADLWGALVFQVIGQEVSLAAARAIRGRLEALQDGRLPTPAELLATDEEALRAIGLSRAFGGSTARYRSPRWTPSASASGRGARWPPCTS